MDNVLDSTALRSKSTPRRNKVIKNQSDSGVDLHFYHEVILWLKFFIPLIARNKMILTRNSRLFNKILPYIESAEDISLLSQFR